jgi:epsilon-lactone hydrolase
MNVQINFTGRPQYRLKAFAELSQSLIEVSARRMVKGPHRVGWNWFVELSTEALRRQLITAFGMPDVDKAREYLDVIEISSPAHSQVEVTKLMNEKVRGSWVVPKNAESEVTVFYLHGGGYSFYPRSYAHFTALIALAATARTFALDYRLSPEFRFPAQLEDAVSAYRWLLQTGCAAEKLVVIGDSAGGNLALGLLLAARESGIALPALAILISPPTDFENEHPSFRTNKEFDWITRDMLGGWCDWFCDAAQRRDPLISPLRADLRGLPPIYIQAGRCEILYDSIRAFAERAREQGADVTLESWEDMTHVFQMFGTEAPQSTEALRRIGEVIGSRLQGQNSQKSLIC